MRKRRKRRRTNPTYRTLKQRVRDQADLVITAHELIAEYSQLKARLQTMTFWERIGFAFTGYKGMTI